MKNFFFVALILLSSHSVLANGYRTRAEVATFHARFDVPRSVAYQTHVEAANEIKLPTSPGYDQAASGLCWFYATLNAVESNILAHSPNLKVAFSRSAMQYLNMEDRYKRRFLNIEDNVYEGGTVVDAMAIMRNVSRFHQNPGLFAFTDFHPQPARASMRNPLGNIAPDQLYSKLAAVYGVPPTTTHDVDGKAMTPQELMLQTLSNQVWVAYSPITPNHPAGIHQHFDPDARKGTVATYIPKADFVKLIGVALKAGHALTISWSGHEEELFGADFDGNGQPTQIFVKGSYGPNYIHIMSASSIDQMMGLTTLALAR